MQSVTSFEAWKKLLLNDCIAQDKQLEFNNLGDFVLRFLYDSGLDPTVKALSSDVPENKFA